MASHVFTKNHRDHSNDTGFQFEFFCDKCGNGHRSSYKTNKVGFMAEMVKAASALLGTHSYGYGADHVKDALRGPAWDSAFKDAIEEIKPRFHQCTRCGQWVCPDVCWNEKRQLCEGCAPDIQEEAGAIQARVAVEQAELKAREHDQSRGVDMSAHQQAACPQCRAGLAPNVKFCADCGYKLVQEAKTFCSECGTSLAAGAKFCGNCGTKHG
jgi:hypothetical protein